MTLLAAPVSTREAAALSPFSGCAKRPLRAQNISPSRCTSDRSIMGRDTRCAIIEVPVTVRVKLVTGGGRAVRGGRWPSPLCFQALAPRSPRSPGRPLDRAAGVTNLAAVVGTGVCALVVVATGGDGSARRCPPRGLRRRSVELSPRAFRSRRSSGRPRRVPGARGRGAGPRAGSGRRPRGSGCGSGSPPAGARGSARRP